MRWRRRWRWLGRRQRAAIDRAWDELGESLASTPGSYLFVPTVTANPAPSKVHVHVFYDDGLTNASFTSGTAIELSPEEDRST